MSCSAFSQGLDVNVNSVLIRLIAFYYAFPRYRIRYHASSNIPGILDSIIKDNQVVRPGSKC